MDWLVWLFWLRFMTEQAMSKMDYSPAIYIYIYTHMIFVQYVHIYYICRQGHKEPRRFSGFGSKCQLSTQLWWCKKLSTGTLTHVSTLRFLLSVRCGFNQWFAEDDLQIYVGFPRIYVSLQEDSGGFQRSSWHVPEKVIPVPKWSPNYTLALLQDVISQVTCCKGPQKIGQPWSAPKSVHGWYLRCSWMSGALIDEKK